MVPEDDLGSCPWACSLDVAGDHVIMAIQLEQSAELVPKVLTLAAQHELVCFDPQATKVHLPPHLSAMKAAAASVACGTASEKGSPSDLQIVGIFEFNNALHEPEKP